MVKYSNGSNPHASEKRHGRAEIHDLKNCGSQEKHGSSSNSGPAFYLLGH
jgi:hypothetical protein